MGRRETLIVLRLVAHLLTVLAVILAAWGAFA